MKKMILSLCMVVGLSFAGMAQEKSKVAEEFVNTIVENDVSKAYHMFSDEAKQMVTQEQVGEITEQINQQLGNPKKLHGAYETEESEGGQTFQVVYYHVEYDAAEIDYKLVLNDNNQIDGFFLVPHEARNEGKKN